jgi:hypothetical protein
MTTQGILILAGIVSAFAIFGITLAWADFYSQRGPKMPAADASPSQSKDQNFRDERRAA